MSVIGSNILAGASGQAVGYQVSRSLRFNSSDSAYLSRTPASAGNRKTWTWAAWVKRSKLGSNTENHHLMRVNANVETAVRIKDDNVLEVYSLASGTYGIQIRTSALLRDLSAWYHVVFSVDTTQASSADRVKLYLNGVQLTSFSISTYPSQNYDTGFNQAVAHAIGASPTPSEYFDGYLADIHFIDGQALTPSSFTEVSATTGQLIPKAYTGSFGTNGFWLKFSDNSNNTATTLGKDYSGNSNNWTPNNLSVTAGAGNDSLVDTPTSYGTDTGAGGEVRGNYCTWNPLNLGLTNVTFSNGNLDMAKASGTNEQAIGGTLAVTSGKWYWEIVWTAISGDAAHVGVGQPSLNSNAFGYYFNPGRAYRSANGNKVTSGAGGPADTSASYGASWTINDVISVALDADNGSVTFYKNGVSQGAAFTGLTFTSYIPTIFLTGGPNSGNAVANFGQRPWAFPSSVPSGFKALCDTNLPAPVVAKPNTVMDVLTWSGSGGARSFTGLGFSPDLVWGKARNASGSNHVLYDAVRGAGNNKDLSSSSTSEEGSAFMGTSIYGYLSSFDSAGFSVANGTDSNFPSAYWNQSGRTYVAWAWDAGSSTVTNPDGSITSQVRANASAGFSVVTYTGTGTTGTVGHGLGVAPGFIIVKSRSNGGSFDPWVIYHSSLGKSSGLLFNTDAAFTDTDYWGTSGPGSTTFSAKGTSGVNRTSQTYVAYCFAPVAGYTSAGSYTGNGSADGPFVYTSMRPRWILLKRTDSTGNWTILDTAREGYNVDNDPLYPNLADAEGTADLADILSNGFKLRSTDASVNASAGTYIYFAISEAAFQYARAR